MSKRLGGMGKLSDFGQTQTPQAAPQQQETPKKQKATQASQPAAEIQEKLTTVNIKITRSQQEWLTDTARLVRDNNEEPVAPADRTYPQHLIQVAIELLKASNVDWETVRNVDDLKSKLNL